MPTYGRATAKSTTPDTWRAISGGPLGALTAKGRHQGAALNMLCMQERPWAGGDMTAPLGGVVTSG
eukprot:239609-Alexandrium_andersonii.AAC.1